MFHRSLICSVFIIGSFSFSVNIEGSGEEAKCVCPEVSTTSTTVTPYEDSCRKPCNAETTTTTTVAPTTTVPTSTYGCCCCNEAEEMSTTTPSTTTTTQAARKSCCCCRRRGSNCREQGQIVGSVTCPEGWTRYEQSCYFVESRKMSMMDAQKSCVEKGSTLFVADSTQEFNEVMKKTPTYYWSWIGLGQANSMPKWGVIERFDSSTFKCLPLDDGKQPSWGSYDGVDPSQLKWLINPYSSTVNGWTPLSTCVGHCSGDIYLITFTFILAHRCSILYVSGTQH